MTDTETTLEDPKRQLWSLLGDVRAVMLGSPDPSQHMQPMTPMPAPEERAIWFFTRTDSDIAQAAETGGNAHMCMISQDHDYHACLSGNLQTVRSKEHIDRFWSIVVDAWFPEGKESDGLTMLRFTPQSAAIWATDNSALRFGVEIVKASMSGDRPDVGVSTHVTF